MDRIFLIALLLGVGALANAQEQPMSADTGGKPSHEV